MTNLSGSCLLASLARKSVTAGLNVPADSQTVPCGDRMGLFDALFQTPKGRCVAGAAKASEAARSNSRLKILGFRACMISGSSLSGLVGLLRIEFHRAHDAFAFFYHDHLVRLDLLQGFHQAAGPANFDQLYLLRLADAEVHAQVVLRKIAAAAAHFIDLLMRLRFSGNMRDALHPRADAAAIR